MSTRRRVAAVVTVLVLTTATWIWLRGRAHVVQAQELPHFAATEDYLPGVAADVYLPDPAAFSAPRPVVVLVPGGGWLTADRRGLGPLADVLAGHGMVAINATYRTADSRVRFPVPVADIVCAIDFAVDRAHRAGVTPGPVIVLGH